MEKFNFIMALQCHIVAKNYDYKTENVKSKEYDSVITGFRAHNAEL